MKTFENLLRKKRECVAQKTLINAMVEWRIADNKEHAKVKIAANPGKDLAGIKNSVIAGLVSLADSLGIGGEVLISERGLEALYKATAEMIVVALDAIHRQWVEDNFTSQRWAEKYFKGQLGQYRKTAKLPWTEVKKDLLFINEYLDAGVCKVSDKEIQLAFEAYAQDNAADDDLEIVAEKARTFATIEIFDCIKKFRDGLNPKKKADIVLINWINRFLAEHDDPAEVIEIFIAAVSR